MGHAKVDTTLHAYAQVVDGSLRRAADTVGYELFATVHKPEATAGLPNRSSKLVRSSQRSDFARFTGFVVTAFALDHECPA